MRKHAFYFTADTDMGLVVELLSDAPFESRPRKVEFDKTTGRRLPGKVSLFDSTHEYDYCFVLDSEIVLKNDLTKLFRHELGIDFVSDMFEE